MSVQEEKDALEALSGTAKETAILAETLSAVLSQKWGDPPGEVRMLSFKPIPSDQEPQSYDAPPLLSRKG